MAVEKIYGMIMSGELTWEGLVRDIVKQENLDPWDLDVSKLATMYLDHIKKLQRIDFRLTGKFILTAAILLKMKSDSLSPEELMMPGYYLSDLAGAIDLNKVFERPTVPDDLELTPRLQPRRTRRVTLDELLSALRSAMEVRERRDQRHVEREKIKRMRNNYSPFNIKQKIKELYDKIKSFFKKLGKKQITFVELIPSGNKKDIIWTFLPLLHLSNEGRVELEQTKDFGDIYVRQPERET
jgi:segregation and condensation protein A